MPTVLSKIYADMVDHPPGRNYNITDYYISLNYYWLYDDFTCYIPLLNTFIIDIYTILFDYSDSYICSPICSPSCYIYTYDFMVIISLTWCSNAAGW